MENDYYIFREPVSGMITGMTDNYIEVQLICDQRGWTAETESASRDKKVIEGEYGILNNFTISYILDIGIILSELEYNMYGSVLDDMVLFSNDIADKIIELLYVLKHELNEKEFTTLQRHVKIFKGIRNKYYSDAHLTRDYPDGCEDSLAYMCINKIDLFTAIGLKDVYIKHLRKDDTQDV